MPKPPNSTPIAPTASAAYRKYAAQVPARLQQQPHRHDAGDQAIAEQQHVPNLLRHVIGLGERQGRVENAAPSSPISNGMYWPIQITTPTSGKKISVAQPSDSRV